MASYPLLFGYHDLVAGNGFVAAVAVDGRALLVDEEGGAWVYGVNPGGVAAGGADHGAATAAFRTTYRSVLHDIAFDAHSFAEFQQRVHDFCLETNQPTLEDWEAALAAVRRGEVTADWLVRRPADAPCRVEVVEVASPQPSENKLDEGEALAEPPLVNAA
ncbi:MAG TPA: hypothetical protein VF017_24100 [Thermoanaerobaculia bacterium]|nr:hypothetical protein [Thermoanaerobaculia bacterium]